MELNLPYPAKELWPNARSHWAPKARETKKHRGWARQLATAQSKTLKLGNGPLPIRITVHGKAKGPLPDADNCLAACKSYLDGIADAIGINDRNFAAPTVSFADDRTGRFVIEVGV